MIMRRVQIEEAQLPFDALSQIYELLPHGITFEHSLTIFIPFREGFVRSPCTALFRLEEGENEDWAVVDDVNWVDAGAKRTVRSFC